MLGFWPRFSLDCLFCPWKFMLTELEYFSFELGSPKVLNDFFTIQRRDQTGRKRLDSTEKVNDC